MAGDVLGRRGQKAKGLVGYEEGNMEGMPAGETQLSRDKECSVCFCQWRPFSGCRAAGEQPQGRPQGRGSGTALEFRSKQLRIIPWSGGEVELFGGAVRVYSAV